MQVPLKEIKMCLILCFGGQFMQNLHKYFFIFYCGSFPYFITLWNVSYVLILQIRVYDPSTTQRRPMIDMEWEEYPITSLCISPYNDRYIHSPFVFLAVAKNSCCAFQLTFHAAETTSLWDYFNQVVIIIYICDFYLS